MKEPSYLPSENPRAQRPQYPFRHCMPMQIRFTDIDMIGHLNNNVYLSFMDLAKLNYFKTIRGGGLEISDLNMVVVHVDVDFLAPTFMDEDVEVWTQVTSVGKHSVKLEQRVVNGVTGETKSIGRTVMAGFDPKTSTGLPVEQVWVDAISAYEQRQFER